MIPVVSSNVAVIGYKSGLMTVEYRDGSRYQHPGVSEELHSELMTAESIGSKLAYLRRIGTIGNGVKLNGPAPGAATCKQFLPVQTSSRINVSQADGCCGVAINDASLAGKLDTADSFVCNKCGTEYRPKMFGLLAHWEPVETAELVR